MLRGFIAGVIVTLLALAIFAYVGVTQGTLIPANADAKPGSLERWAARTSLNATVRREMPTGDAPIATSPANLLAGLKIYGANCAACHGAADGSPSTVAVGLYQHAPQLGSHGVEDDPIGETYWKARHGIRLTGMPAFTRTLTDTQLWQVSLFLKNMDQLPPSVDRAWKALRNPVQLAPAGADTSKR